MSLKQFLYWFTLVVIFIVIFRKPINYIITEIEYYVIWNNIFHVFCTLLIPIWYILDVDYNSFCSSEFINEDPEGFIGFLIGAALAVVIYIGTFIISGFLCTYFYYTFIKEKQENVS